eukprot:TRINITY_DN2445_c0_g1_i2.p1 TRINITY_DN2445_c0_g1~~TRINITY_DN2445_c0_g1_i2.p1  ORF type:complete len:216 (-),score=61.59 TRINITY_DN2445_c0_g1_i2:839-1486(-)
MTNSCQTGRQPAAASPAPLTVLRGHQADVTDVKFDALDADLLYSAGADGELRQWSSKARRACLSLRCGSQLLSLLPLPPAAQPATGRRIVSQARDGWLHEWDTRQPAVPLASVRHQQLGFAHAALLGPPLLLALPHEPDHDRRSGVDLVPLPSACPPLVSPDDSAGVTSHERQTVVLHTLWPDGDSCGVCGLCVLVDKLTSDGAGTCVVGVVMCE